MTTQVRLKVLPRFPASVTGDNGVIVTKTAGNYTISFDPSIIPTTDNPLFATKAAAQAYDPVVAAPSFIRIEGYISAGDGGGALYEQVVSQPTHAGKIQIADGTWYEIVGNTLDYRAFGGVGDGVTAADTAINNAIVTLQAHGGGTLVLSGHVIMTGCLAIPYTGTSPPKQPFLRITGEARDVDGVGQGAGLTVGTILDLRYDGVDTLHPAKIDTRGIGNLEIDHLTLKSGGSDNFLMLQTTNTTLNIHDVSVCGNPSNSGTSCAQDACQLGGITSASVALGGVLATNGFQGYGTQFINMEFSHVRHAINFGGSANGVVVQNVTADYTCGSSETHGAPFTFYGVGLGAIANGFYTAQVEVTHYKHGFALLDNAIAHVGGCGYNVFVSVYVGDDGGFSTSAFYLDNTNDNCASNVIIPNFISAALPLLSGTKSNVNTIIDNRVWTDYTPTITATTGALTTYTILEANFKQIGRAMFVFVRASFANIGTGAGALKVTLPFPASAVSAISGFNSSTSVTLGGLVKYDDASSFRVYKYDGTFPVANGNEIIVNMMCEI